MSEAEARTIAELVTRYEFEPKLKDIYVEGADDKAILEGMIKLYNIKGAERVNENETPPLII
jgi:hypothetical protein